MVKIGAELPKLSKKIKLGIRFLEHPVGAWGEANPHIAPG